MFSRRYQFKFHKIYKNGRKLTKNFLGAGRMYQNFILEFYRISCRVLWWKTWDHGRKTRDFQNFSQKNCLFKFLKIPKIYPQKNFFWKFWEKFSWIILSWSHVLSRDLSSNPFYPDCKLLFIKSNFVKYNFIFIFGPPI